eukprot:42917-Prorocentrum_minimum.AAC.4
MAESGEGAPARKKVDSYLSCRVNRVRPILNTTCFRNLGDALVARRPRTASEFRPKRLFTHFGSLLARAGGRASRGAAHRRPRPPASELPRPAAAAARVADGEIDHRQHACDGYAYCPGRQSLEQSQSSSPSLPTLLSELPLVAGLVRIAGVDRAAARRCRPRAESPPRPPPAGHRPPLRRPPAATARGGRRLWCVDVTITPLQTHANTQINRIRMNGIEEGRREGCVHGVLQLGLLDTDTVELTVKTTFLSHRTLERIQFRRQFFTGVVCPCRALLLFVGMGLLRVSW